MLADDTLVTVRRSWSDAGMTGRVRFDGLENFHWSDGRSEYSDNGFMRVAPRQFVHAYMMCDSLVDGEVSHSCMHGPPPHRIRVCIVKKDNSPKTIDEILKRTGTTSLR